MINSLRGELSRKLEMTQSDLSNGRKSLVQGMSSEKGVVRSQLKKPRMHRHQGR